MKIEEIIKEFDDKFNEINRDGIIYSKDNSFIIPENGYNQLEVIKDFLLSSLHSIRQQTIKEIRDGLPKKEIVLSNELFDETGRPGNTGIEKIAQVGKNIMIDEVIDLLNKLK